MLGQNFSAERPPKSVSRNYQRRAYPLRRQNYSLVELLVEIGNPEMLSNSKTIYLYPSGALHGENLRNKKAVLAARRTVPRSVNPYCQAKENPNCNRVGLPDKGENNYHPHARIPIDVEELFGGISKPPLYVPLKPGDAIYIPPPGIIQVYGEVERRGTLRIGGGSGNNGASGSDGIKPTLFSALSSALGLTYAADIHNIEIFRELEFGKRIVLTVDFEDLVLRKTRDVRLRDGDIIWVPSQSGRFTEANSINAINQLIGTGSAVERTAVIRPN